MKTQFGFLKLMRVVMPLFLVLYGCGSGGGSEPPPVVTPPPVTDNPPTVSIQSPDGSVPVSGMVEVKTTATDDNGVVNVELFVDDVSWSVMTSGPFNFNWDSTKNADGSPANDGEHVLKVVATDTIEQTSQSTVTVISDNVIDPPVNDMDGDMVSDAVDNCVNVANGPNEPAPDGNQADMDGDGIGNACDSDIDGDGIANDDEGPIGTNPRKFDTDGDGVGDATDQCPLDWSNTLDSDGDTVCEFHDRFPNDPNEFADTDNDGIGNNADPDFSIYSIKVTPDTVYGDALSSTTFKVEIAVSGVGTPFVEYTTGPFGSGDSRSQKSYDDGTNGDDEANDGVYTRMISGIPNRDLLYYDSNLDLFSISIRPFDDAEQPIQSGGYANTYNVGLVDRANQCVPKVISDSIMACPYAMNVKIHGYGEMKVRTIHQTGPMAAMEVFKEYPDIFNFLSVFETGRNLLGSGAAFGFTFHNTVSGIGLSVVPEDQEFFGATRNLRFLSFHRNTALLGTAFIHESGHQFCCYYSDADSGVIVTGNRFVHFALSDQNGGDGGFMLGGGMQLDSNSGNFKQVSRDPIASSVYTDLTLYTMGLIDKSSLLPQYFALPDADLASFFETGTLPFNEAVRITSDLITDVYDERIPSFANSPKEFIGAIVFVSGDEFVSEEKFAFGDTLGRYNSSNKCAKYVPEHDYLPPQELITKSGFACATGFRGTMVLELPEPLPQ